MQYIYQLTRSFLILGLLAFALVVGFSGITLADEKAAEGEAKASSEKKADGEMKADGDAKADGEKKSDGDAKAEGEEKAPASK